MATVQLGSRIELKTDGVQGTVAYIGTTFFSTGKWIGVILDDPVGKNNGTVQGKEYFQCKENHGKFVRLPNLFLIDDSGNKVEPTGISGTSSATSPDDTPRSTARSRLSSSRQSLASKSRESLYREDVTMMSSLPTPTHHTSEPTSKRASFIERTQSTPKPSNLRQPTVNFTPKVGGMFKTPKPFTPANAESAHNKQTGFVETLKPQFTPGQVLPSPNAAPKGPPPPDPAELESLKSQVTDLNEKLDTMKIKYKEKLHESEQLRLQLNQGQEFKAKIMDAQAALKKELAIARKERQEAIDSKEDLADISETLEMATLDKEMAEEKVESLQLELDQTKERLEELTIDYQLLKEEMSLRNSDITEMPSNNYQIKQLEQQNTRLKDTLVRMRDLAAQEKHEMLKLTRQLESNRNENAEIVKTNEKLQGQVKELEEQITDLHEQVDAALGAEEMVEQLGLQKLNLEDRVKELEENIADLEALQELNDQLQEGFRELEVDLREEVDMANAATRQASREKEAVLESLADRELTILRFRELVHKLQTQLSEMELQLEKESSNKATVASIIPEMLDFKKMFAETKAHARAIDLELRRMEVQQAQLHVQYLLSYMPDSFMNRGGDNDAVLALLFFPRLLRKCEVLMTQVRDKFPPVQSVDKATLTQGHTVQQYAARCNLFLHLHGLQAILKQFVYGLNTCSPDTLLKVGAAYSEISLQERILDSYIELLRMDQLDENVNTEALEKCVLYFNTTHPLYLIASGEVKLHQSYQVTDLGKALLAACESISTDANIVQVLLQKQEEPSQLLLLCQHLSTVCEVATQHLKQIRRKVASFDTPELPIPELDLQKCYHLVSRLTKVIREVSKVGLSQIALGGEIEVDIPKLMDTMTTVWEKVFDNDDSPGPIPSLKLTATNVTADIAQLAQSLQDAEANLTQEKSEKIIPPITLRASQVKSELEETKVLKSKLETREADLRELKVALRNKQEELGEIVVRKDLIEKRLTTQTREYEINSQTLQRKLEDTQQQMKRKEKEFEETMDHLQADIDSLESERGELKDKLKIYSKKIFIESAKSVASPTSLSVSTGGGVVRESPILLNEIRSLHRALQRERAEKLHLETDYYKKQLRSLKPITVPKKEVTSLDHLWKKLNNLQKEVQIGMLPTVVDISKRTPGVIPSLDKNNPVNHIAQQMCRAKDIQEKVLALQTEINNEAIKRKRGGRIETDLATFPTPEMSKALLESEFEVIGTITINSGQSSNKTPEIVPLSLTYEQLRNIQEKLYSIGL
uniref:Dynactin subunit 1 n=1 Tax=Clastoptera arizonana TaxID=38151 RepID=A0A1B6C177_9HEMI